MHQFRYTAKEILKNFGITPYELYAWRKTGAIDFRKRNGRVFFYKMPNFLPEEYSGKYGSTEITESKFPIYKSIMSEEVKPLEIRDFSVWYTADDIMEMFNVNRQMLRYWRLTGKIEFEKFNARVFRYKFPIL